MVLMILSLFESMWVNSKGAFVDKKYDLDFEYFIFKLYVQWSLQGIT